MSIKLDNPTVKYEATDNAVTRIIIDLPHSTDPEDGTFGIDNPLAMLRADVSTFDDEGGLTGTLPPTFLPYDLWPSHLQKAIEDLIDFVEDSGNAGQGTKGTKFKPPKE